MNVYKNIGFSRFYKKYSYVCVFTKLYLKYIQNKNFPCSAMNMKSNEYLSAQRYKTQLIRNVGYSVMAVQEVMIYRAQHSQWKGVGGWDQCHHWLEWIYGRTYIYTESEFEFRFEFDFERYVRPFRVQVDVCLSLPLLKYFRSENGTRGLVKFRLNTWWRCNHYGKGDHD